MIMSAQSWSDAFAAQAGKSGESDKQAHFSGFFELGANLLRGSLLLGHRRPSCAQLFFRAHGAEQKQFFELVL